MKKSKPKPNSKPKTSNVFIKQFLGYALILILLLQTIITLSTYYKPVLFNSSNVELYFGIVFAICLIPFIYLNRDRLLDSEENWFVRQELEQKSMDQFQNKNPRLSSIPIIGFLAKKWKVEPIFFKMALIGLCILGGLIYGFELSYYDWLPDEPLVVKAAKGYLDSGTFAKWNFWMDEPGTDVYKRAWPHTWMVAQSIKIFGLSEWSTRMVSGFFGVLFIIILYGVSNFFLKNRIAALLVTFACIMNPYFIVYFRRVRMYAVLIPFFVLLYYMMYQILTTEKYKPKFIYENRKWTQKYLNYDWMMVLGTLVLLYFSIQIHKLSFIIFPLIFPLFLYLLIVKKQVRLLIPLIIGSIGVFALNSKLLASTIEGKFVFFEVYKEGYIKDFLGYPFPTSLTIGLLVGSLLFVVYGKIKTETIALYFLVAVSFLFYVYIIDFQAHFRYIIHLLPFSYMLIIGLLYKANGLLEKNWQKVILPVLIAVLAIVNFTNQYEWIYHKYPEAQFSSQAYTTITKNINPEKEGIIGLYLGDMYFPGMGKTTRRIDMLNNKQYSLQQFQQDVRQFENGAWVTWATHKTYHLRPELIEYISRNCAKYHGYGVDNTLTEVFICK